MAGLTPNSTLDKIPDTAMAAATPITAPIATGRRVRRRTMPSTLRALAPNAMRMPISR